MKCFLRTNSPKILRKLTKADILVCVCSGFNDAEWLSYNEIAVHGVYPGDDEEELGTELIFGTKDTFKDIFLEQNKDYVDCGEDVELFIETIKRDAKD